MKDEKKSLRELTAEAMARTRRNNPEFARRIEELFGDAEIAEAGEAALPGGGIGAGV